MMNPSSISFPLHHRFGWIFRWKLYHLPFWFGYHFLWWTLRIGSPAGVISSLALPHAAAKFIFCLIFQMLGVYFNLYFLIPKYLEKGKYLTYILLLLITIIGTAACIVCGYYVGAAISEATFEQLYGTAPANYFSLFESGALPSTVAAMTLAMSIKLTRNWMQARQLEQRLREEKLETELKFLRSQFNPHFLFNTINSIFVLIHKNPTMASESLAKFSGLLRYQLYECNEQLIPLKRELAYLENFIELEKLRQEGNTECTLSVNVNLDQTLEIAPFILMPFVENAFKHLSQHKEEMNRIRIDIHTVEDLLHFKVANTSGPMVDTSTGIKQYQGIGLANVRRRLDLLYPSQHTLLVDHLDGTYRVSLELKLVTSRPAVLKSKAVTHALSTMEA
jgi:two-component system, LytTR family, sensor kinase